MFIPPDPMLISPETLLARHRLSSRQVNDYLKGRRSVEPLEERLATGRSWADELRDDISHLGSELSALADRWAL